MRCCTQLLTLHVTHTRVNNKSAVEPEERLEVPATSVLLCISGTVASRNKSEQHHS